MPKRRTPPNNIGSYITGIIGGGAFLYVLSRVPDWDPFFITNAFSEVLWILKVSLIVQIVGNGLLLLFHPLFPHHLINLMFTVVSFVAVYRVFTVFPFDFTAVNDWLPVVVRIGLIGAMVGMVIASIVHLLGFRRTCGSGDLRVP